MNTVMDSLASNFLIICLGAFGTLIVIIVAFGLAFKYRKQILAMWRPVLGGPNPQVSVDANSQNQAILKARELYKTNAEGREIDLAQVKDILDYDAYFESSSLSIINSQVVLGNSEGKPTVAVAGRLKNYKPFTLDLAIKFGPSVLQELQMTIENDWFCYYCQGKLIGRMRRAPLVAEQGVDYTSFETEEGQKILWHDRPYYNVSPALFYNFYTDGEKTQKIAEITRVKQLMIFRRDNITSGLGNGKVAIHFLPGGTIQQKQLILGFFCFDLLFGY